MKSITQSELVATHPATGPSSPTTSKRAETAQINITAPIAIGETRGPQVVACTVTQSRTSKCFRAAAKIYDPLYYKPVLDLNSSAPRDCVYEAEQAYRNEVAAYEHLENSGQSGGFSPEYYGSWTLSLPITIKGKPQTRDVRLILIELLEGTSIEATRVQNAPERSMGKDSFHYPEEYRFEVLSRALDGYVRLLKTGLDQRDCAGRNVVLVPNSDSDPKAERVCGLVLPRVVLIDYNIATISDPPQEQGDLPPNPAEIFWCEYFWHDFPGWVPNEWEDTALHRGDALQKDWLMRRFHSDDRQYLYRPFSENFLEALEEERTRPAMLAEWTRQRKLAANRGSPPQAQRPPSSGNTIIPLRLRSDAHPPPSGHAQRSVSRSSNRSDSKSRNSGEEPSEKMILPLG